MQRSDELLAVNQPAAALSSVSEIFSSKRFRTTPLSSLEPIMLRFLELCVMLRKGRTAKEGLWVSMFQRWMEFAFNLKMC